MIINQLEKLDWDSEFFGFPVGKVTITGELKNIEDLINPIPFRLLYVFSNQILNIESVITSKMITYGRTLENNSYNGRSEFYSDRASISTLFNLAFLSGKYSRFCIDPNITEAKFKELYSQWVVNSVNKSFADEIIVRKINDEIVGMITVKKRGEIGQIGLFAVGNEFQGKGIGCDLILCGMQYLQKVGCKEVTVQTQKENMNACRFYEKLDYKIYNEEYVYHCWN